LEAVRYRGLREINSQISNSASYRLPRLLTQVLDVVMKSKSDDRVRAPLAARQNEVEVKLPVTDVPALRRRLEHLGARQISARTHEFNTLYDSQKKKLARRGQMIRIRSEQPAPRENQQHRMLQTEAKLTFKGPVHGNTGKSSTTRLLNKGRYKVREELELTLSDGKQMCQILCALGLRPTFRYEKFRTTYGLKSQRNLKIEFDETPIGTFLELEGSPSSINRVARLVGYAPPQYITQTYGTLYVTYMRQHGLKPSNMLFSTTKKSR
jgi:adenylate cyclase class 2